MIVLFFRSVVMLIDGLSLLHFVFVEKLMPDISYKPPIYAFNIFTFYCSSMDGKFCFAKILGYKPDPFFC